MARTTGVVNRRNGVAKEELEKPTNGHITANASGEQKTDYSRWRLRDDDGCQTWHYLETNEELKAWPQTTADKYHLGLDTVIVFF
jgi:lanosterol synthase